MPSQPVTVIATYEAIGGPAAPSNLVATVISASQIDLSWTDNADNEDGFRIERKVGGGSFSELTTVASSAGTGGTVSHSDTTVAAGTGYLNIRQTGSPQPLANLITFKSHPEIVVFLAQKLMVVPVNVCKHKRPAGQENPGHLLQGIGGIRHMMQVHVGKNRIHAVVR